MVEISLTEKTPLEGKDVTIGERRLRELDNLHLTSLAIPLGQDAKFAKGLKDVTGLEMPDARLSVGGAATRAIRSGPDQILLLHETELDVSIFADVAYVTDQTSNWCVVELSGEGTLAALERLCPVDLSKDAFPVGAFARTQMEHMGAIVLRTDKDRYMLLSASSSAKSFWHALEKTLRFVL